MLKREEQMSLLLPIKSGGSNICTIIIFFTNHVTVNDNIRRY